tara:strand:- start:745 stop:894 length:150 start_codon:yes stop_codon:yes gene_type:complete
MLSFVELVDLLKKKSVKHTRNSRKTYKKRVVGLRKKKKYAKKEAISHGL